MWGTSGGAPPGWCWDVPQIPASVFKNTWELFMWMFWTLWIILCSRMFLIPFWREITEIPHFPVTNWKTPAWPITAQRRRRSGFLNDLPLQPLTPLRRLKQTLVLVFTWNPGLYGTMDDIKLLRWFVESLKALFLISSCFDLVMSSGDRVFTGVHPEAERDKLNHQPITFYFLFCWRKTSDDKTQDQEEKSHQTSSSCVLHSWFSDPFTRLFYHLLFQSFCHGF